MKTKRIQNLLAAAVLGALAFTSAYAQQTIYLQNESPGTDKESNWLPVPAQPFSLHARLYSPRPPAIDGTWAMPVVEKLK